MKKKPITDEQLNRIIRYMAIALLGMALVFMAMQFAALWTWILDAIRAVIVPVIIGYLIALIIFPLIKYLEKKGIGPRGLSLAIVFLITAGIIFAAFYFLTPLIVNEISDFFNVDIPIIKTYLTTDMRDQFILGTALYDQISAYITETDVINVWLEGLLPSIIASLTNVLLPIITVGSVLPILLVYYLLDYEMIGEKLRTIVPQKHTKNLAELGGRLNQTVGAYLRGQLFLMVAIGSVATIIYKLIGLKYFLVFGLIVGVTNIIPYFGSIISAIPPLLYAFIANQTGGPGPLIVLVVNVSLQMVEGNIFQPIIMGKALEMHPLIILMSILLFGSLFGTIGVIFASPIAASIRVFLEFRRDLQQRKAALAQEGGVSP